MRRKITILDHQSIFDIALREYGSVEGIFLLLKDNPTLDGVDALLVPGAQLSILSDPLDKPIVDHFQANVLYPVTGDLYIPDPCLLYPNVPTRHDADQQTRPSEQAGLEGGLGVVNRRYLIDDLDLYEDTPDLSNLFSRNTGNVAMYLGSGAGTGTEGSDWEIEVIPAKHLVRITVGAAIVMWRVSNAANGTVLYPSGKFALRWLAPPLLTGSYDKTSGVTEIIIAPTDLSQCRFWQVYKAEISAPTVFAPFGDRNMENGPNAPWLDHNAFYYIQWTTGAPESPSVQGVSQTVYQP